MPVDGPASSSSDAGTQKGFVSRYVIRPLILIPSRACDVAACSHRMTSLACDEAGLSVATIQPLGAVGVRWGFDAEAMARWVRRQRGAAWVQTNWADRYLVEESNFETLHML